MLKFRFCQPNVPRLAQIAAAEPLSNGTFYACADRVLRLERWALLALTRLVLGLIAKR